MRLSFGVMSTGDVLDRGLRLLFGRLGTFYLIHLLVNLPNLAHRLQATGPDANRDMPSQFGWLLLDLFLTVVGVAATLRVIEREYVGRRVGPLAALGFAFTRFFPLLAGFVLFLLVVTIASVPASLAFEAGLGAGGLTGALVLGLPPAAFPVWLVLACSLFPQAVVLERCGPLQGLNRSYALTRGYRWRVLATLLLVSLLYLGSLVVTGLAFRWFLPTAEAVRDAAGAVTSVRAVEPNRTIYVVALALLAVLLSTYWSVCQTLIYFDLRVRKEGFDLELAARALAPPAEEV